MAKNETPAAETEAPATSREMVIAGITFTVNTPYSAGHVVTEAEARVLNQTRCENISNATRVKVKDLADAEGNYSDEAVQKAADLVAEYDASYTFASGGGVARRAIDPLEKKALSIARAEVTRLLKAQGLKVKDVDAEVINANVEAFAANPQVIELAKKWLAEQSKISNGLELNLE